MQRLIFNQITPAKEQSFLPFALTDIFTEFVHSNHIEIIHFVHSFKFILQLAYKKQIQE